MSDFEEWSRKPGEDTIDDICLWYKSAHHETTGAHIRGEDHPMYKCQVCEDYKNFKGGCDNYKSQYTIRIKRWERACRIIDDYYKLWRE